MGWQIAVSWFNRSQTDLHQTDLHQTDLDQAALDRIEHDQVDGGQPLQKATLFRWFCVRLP